MEEHIRNALAGERSPYLQHGATQPVRWFAWGQAAFDLARAEDRPLLLDIGAVWCHWCHVMDRESYGDAQVAALINEWFVPVKVDRDERPDVDARYQRAVQALTGQGGWPLTAFLTPEGEVFYGGTYFPPGDGMGRPSFSRVLHEVARIWREDRERALDAARLIEQQLAGHARVEARSGDLMPELPARAVEDLARSFDIRYGGFGTAPKFASPSTLDLLLDEWLDQGEPWVRRMHRETLNAMARGGIHDQLGGGFHRYATDARWLIPHFEKMAYDNGPLLATYARAWAATGEPHYRQVCDGIVNHYLEVDPELLAQGLIPASQDADIGPDDDGAYWTWNRTELAAAVGGNERREALAALHWGLEQDGGRMPNDRSRHVLFEAMAVEQVAERSGVPAEEVRAELAQARHQLLAARQTRARPYVDTSQYSGWASLVASGLLAAARYTGRADALGFGLQALDRLGARPGLERGVPHRVGDPESPELLEDQAYLLQALLDAFELTQRAVHLQRARQHADVLLDRFAREDSPALADRAATDAEAAKPLARPQLSIADAPTPAGNAAAALALLRLADLSGEERFRAQGRAILGAFAGSAAALGSAAATYLRALSWATRDPLQVVVVGHAEVGRDLLAAALATYRPRLTVRWRDLAEPDGEGLAQPLATVVDASYPRAYVCSGFQCFPPVTDVAGLHALLAPPAQG